MKTNEIIQKLGISQKTIDQTDLDPTRLVIEEEFGKPAGNYRPRVIKRLTEARINFSSDANIIYDMARDLISVKCPHCNGTTKARGGGGNAETSSVHYTCINLHCLTTVYLRMPNDGISIRPEAPERTLHYCVKEIPEDKAWGIYSRSKSAKRKVRFKLEVITKNYQNAIQTALTLQDEFPNKNFSILGEKDEKSIPTHYTP